MDDKKNVPTSLMPIVYWWRAKPDFGQQGSHKNFSSAPILTSKSVEKIFGRIVQGEERRRWSRAPYFLVSSKFSCVDFQHWCDLNHHRMGVNTCVDFFCALVLFSSSLSVFTIQMFCFLVSHNHNASLDNYKWRGAKCSTLDSQVCVTAGREKSKRENNGNQQSLKWWQQSSGVLKRKYYFESYYFPFIK